MSAEDSNPVVANPVESAPEAVAPETVAPEATTDVPTEEKSWRYSLWDLLDETLWGCVFLGVWLFLFFWGGDHEDLVCRYGSYLSGGFAILFWMWAFLRKVSKKPDKKSPISLFAWASVLTLVAAGLCGIALSQKYLHEGSLLVLCGYGTLVLGYWIWLIYQIFVRKMFVEYKLTPKQFIHKHGFLIAREERYEIWDIEQVNMKANLWQRIVGVGEVELLIKDQKYNKTGKDIVTGTAAGGLFTLPLPGLRNPSEVQGLINQYRMYVRTQVLNSVVSA